MNKTEAVNTQSIEDISLSTDPETEGFDTLAGQTWIYPTNYTLRDYQYNIIQKALLNNTMVSLPTGLGKTFIAAVVMYNFYRWYPRGKIVFMAPTRPLVKQQIDACYNIMSIPKEVTAELTGTKGQVLRKEVWKEKRVFFITPQVLQNDLNILTELAGKIKCLVFDEAHKAKGNHAYCEVIKKLTPHNKCFRVLGLSATPGNTLNDVLDVISNLLISHIEIRTDESPDVSPFVFQRALETVVVPLGGKLQDVRDSYINILEKYTRVLVKYKIVNGNCANLTKGKIFMIMKEYKERSRGNRDAANSEIMKSLNICITLYHGYELLIRHGLRAFLSFFEEHSEKPLLRGNTDLLSIMKDIQAYLGPVPNVVPLPDGSIEEIPKSCTFGHPKFYKLRDILSEHFTKLSEINSRVIVFCEYRESVMEAHALLLQHRPLIRPRTFVGQSSITQKQQINVIKAFRCGECNTLISTCIGEEGLDVGDVDLIVCFDISNKSPVRMVQRMGRTGRKREGRVVVLVTEGKEQQTLKECLIHKENLNSHILKSSALTNGMYAHNPRMIPSNIEPQCRKLFITVEKDSNNLLTKKKSSTIKDMFDNINKHSSDFLPTGDDVIIADFNERLPQRHELWNKTNPLNINNDTSRIDFSKQLSKFRNLQPTGSIGHSRSSELLVSMLQLADSKKYNIVTTQVPVLLQSSQLGQNSLAKASARNYKQSDIRNMFFKPPSSSQLLESERVSGDRSTPNINYLDSLYTEIIRSIGVRKLEDVASCTISANLFNCSNYCSVNVNVEIKSWIELDSSTFNSLSIDNLNSFKTLLTENENAKTLPEVIICENTETYTNNVNVNCSKDILLVDKFAEIKDSPFKPPSNIKKILNKCSILENLDDSFFNAVSFTQLEKATPISSTPAQKVRSDIDCTFDINSFEAAQFTQLKKVPVNYEQTLNFFNLTSLDELFDDTHLKATSYETSPESQDTIIYSPNLPTDPDTPNRSPIISSFSRQRFDRNKVQKRLFDTSKCTNEMEQIEKSLVQKTLNAVNDISEDIFNESPIQNPTQKISKEASVKALDISDDDIFDDSDIFAQPIAALKPKDVGNQKSDISISINDCVDLSFFGLLTTEKEDYKKLTETSPIIRKVTQERSTGRLKNNKIKEGVDLCFLESNSQEKTPEKQQTQIYVTTPLSKNNIPNHEERKECSAVLQDFCDETFLNLFFDTSEVKPSSETQVAKALPVHIQNEQQQASSSKAVPEGFEVKPSSETEVAKPLAVNIKIGQQQANSSNAGSDRFEAKSSNETEVAKSLAVNIKNGQQASISKAGLDRFEVKPSSETEVVKSLAVNNKNEQQASSSKASSNKAKLLRLSTKTDKNIEIEKLLPDPDVKHLPTSPILPRSRFNRWSLSQRSPVNKSRNLFCADFISTQKSPILSVSQFNSSCLSPKSQDNKSRNLECTVSIKVPQELTFAKPKQTSAIRLSTKLNRNASSEFQWYKKGTEVKQSVSNVIELDDSDDDFEMPTRFNNKPYQRVNEVQTTSKSPLQKSKTKLACKRTYNSKQQTKKRTKNNCDYLDVEAEMSIDGNESFDTSMEASDDEFEASFMDDETQNLANSTMMHAHYLQSTRDVHLNEGKFKIPNKALKPKEDVCSQPVNDVDDTYLNDSFCVGSQNTEEFHNTELSELELAELILKDERKRKKRKNSSDVPRKKPRLIIISSSSESE